MASRLTELCQQLAAPFPPDELEWRLAQSGVKNDKVWARALTYITSRALMDRFDEVFGPGNWQDKYVIQEGATVCSIGVKDPETGEWIWKTDGTGELQKTDGLSESDAKKGDFSNAFKRTGVKWGASRYLYWLEDSFVDVFGDKRGKLRGSAKGEDGKKVSFTWNPPKLPDWALPGGTGRPHKTGKAPERDPYTKDMFEDQAPPAPSQTPPASPPPTEDVDDSKEEATAAQHRRLAQLAALMQTSGFNVQLGVARKKLVKSYNKKTAGVAIRELKEFLKKNGVEWEEEQAENP